MCLLLVPRHNISHLRLQSITITPPCALDTIMTVPVLHLLPFLLHPGSCQSLECLWEENFSVLGRVRKAMTYTTTRQKFALSSCVSISPVCLQFRSTNALPPNGGAMRVGRRRVGRNEHRFFFLLVGDAPSSLPKQHSFQSEEQRDSAEQPISQPASPASSSSSPPPTKPDLGSDGHAEQMLQKKDVSGPLLCL